MGFFDAFAFGYTAIVPRINFKNCSIIQFNEEADDSLINLNEDS